MANNTYTKTDIEQLKDLATKLSTNSNDISTSITNYIGNLSNIESSNFLQGIATEAINRSCDKIRSTCEEFKNFADSLANKIKEIAQDVLDIDTTEAQNNQDIYDSNPLDFNGENSGSNNTPTSGETIDIPDGLGKNHTYMGWSKITNRSSAQYQFREDAGEHYDSEGFAKVDGRYVIACTDTFGEIGDYVDFELKDGTVIHGVIGDFKNQSDAGCNEWGHNNGNVIVEYVVNTDTWYGCGHPNPGEGSFHPEWNQEIVSATNVGSFYD